MNPSRPIVQHADAVHSGAFTGNLRRASLLPGEIALRPPVSQEARASAGRYPRPASASIYVAAAQPWWHWPTLAATAALTLWMLISAMSGGGG